MFSFNLNLKKSTSSQKDLKIFKVKNSPFCMCNAVYKGFRLLSRVKAQGGLKNTFFVPVGRKNCQNRLKNFFWRKNPKKFL